MIFVHITEDDKGQPFEVFMSLGKAGGAAMADAEAIGRLISLALRSGIPLRRSIVSCAASRSDRAIGLGPNKVMSVPDAIGLALEEWLPTSRECSRSCSRIALRAIGSADCCARADHGEWPARESEADDVRVRERRRDESFIGTCPDCGSQLEFAEGCVKCHVCGFSECG